MTLRDALKFFDLDYKITDGNEIKVIDTAGRFKYEEICNDGEEALDYGVKEVMVNNYFYNDDEIVPKNLRDMNLEQIYNYYIDNAVENDYIEIIGVVSGILPVVVEEWFTEKREVS